MGSTSPRTTTTTTSFTTSPSYYTLPDASSPALIVTQPTPSERVRVWTMTHPKWGAALANLDDYLGRELYLHTVPLARDGGLTNWILTDASLAPDERPILSSCESLRKRAAVAASAAGEDDDGQGVVDVEEGVAHGIASVFTEDRYRGRGYASRMMQEVGRALEGWQVGGEEPGEEKKKKKALFSVLYSDIGKSFYAKNGWAPFPSAHVSFEPVKEEGSEDTRANGEGTLAKPIGYHELAELCAVDEALLKEKLKASVSTGSRKKNAAAILPSLDQLLWHMMREDYMTKHIFGRTPTVRGAVYGQEKGKRMWAIWSRGYYGGLDKIEGNTFHILRFVVEDEQEGADASKLAEGFRSIIQIARHEAAEWRSQDVQMWNPSPLTRRLIDASGLEYKFVDREDDSIASLRWHGKGELDEWVANEKYAWC